MGYKEKTETLSNSFITNIIHLLFFEDGTVAKIVDSGEIVLISAIDRYILNENGANREENDIDYWL